MIIEKIKLNNGFVLLFAVTISAILLSIALGVSQIAFKEVNLSISGKDSNDAFFAADTGAECALFFDRSDQNKFPIGNSQATLDCAGSNINTLLPAQVNFWTFNVLNLGSTGKGCAIVTIDKKTTPGTTYVISNGYNTATAPCTPIKNVSVERELDVTY